MTDPSSAKSTSDSALLSMTVAGPSIRPIAPTANPGPLKIENFTRAQVLVQEHRAAQDRLLHARAGTFVVQIGGRALSIAIHEAVKQPLELALMAEIDSIERRLAVLGVVTGP